MLLCVKETRMWDVSESLLRLAADLVLYVVDLVFVCVLCRGELRIYLRDRPLNPLLPMDDSDRDYE